MKQYFSPDQLVSDDNWSDLTQYQEMPAIDFECMHAYRLQRIRSELKKTEADMCLLVNPISLRYAVDYRTYGLFQSHIPTTYLFVPLDGPVIIHNAYLESDLVDNSRVGPPISFFDGGTILPEAAEALADEMVNYLRELGTDYRRVALEYVNPSLTQALLKRDVEVIDGVVIAEMARLIKSEEEIACMRWAVAVAELGISKLQQALRPGVSELQLWGLLNYANLANNGDWHEGRMLASGSRINPWLQEASPRKVEEGDLVGFDTDMVGPFGYFADVSRTLYCGKGNPSNRQRELYRLAVSEVEHNIALLRPGLRFSEFQQQAFKQDECFHQNAYTCITHAVGMCDEYPRINQGFRGPNPYDGVFEAGMVMCLESYVGAVGERDGVKLEQQVLITETGTEPLSTYPWDERLMG
ncbi:MAG: M24 family metallopeptidase [Thiolinea sp.]